MRLVVQIPCLNEESTLALVLESIPERIPGIDDIVVLVVEAKGGRSGSRS